MTEAPVEWIETEIVAGRLDGSENPQALFNNWDRFSDRTQSRIEASLDKIQARAERLRAKELLEEELQEIEQFEIEEEEP
jgi:hypothetical protein